MKNWTKKLEEIFHHIDKFQSDGVDVFFRGQSDAEWDLIPGIARVKKKRESFENRVYYDFVSYGAHLFENHKNTWDTLFLMQHHGLPTRLLDWSENFSVALYFALKGAINKPAAMWLLDPYKLNTLSCEKELIDYLDVSYPAGYYNYFVDDGFEEYGNFPAPIVAIGANPPNKRIVSQKGTFTMHKELGEPLNKLFPDVVVKIEIEPDLFDEARKFLYLTGVNEFSLFPDLDGLARFIRSLEVE